MTNAQTIPARESRESRDVQKFELSIREQGEAQARLRNLQTQYFAARGVS
jgi:hypothetical protein